MKRLLAVLLLATWPASAQVDVTTAPCSMTDGSCSSSGTSVPATCTTAGMVPVFLGSPLALGCDAGISYDATGDKLTTGVIDKGGQVFNVKAYGAVCDGTTDDSTAVQAAITAAAVSGGTVFFPACASKYKITAQLAIPEDGQPSPQQKTIRLTGEGYGASGKWVGANTPGAASILDLQYVGTTGKILTIGDGLLEIDHLQLTDTVDGTTAFVYTTSTTLDVHNVSFIGKRGPTALTLGTVTKGSPTTIASTAHGMTDGALVVIAGGTGNWTGLNGTRAITRVDADSFTVAVDSGAYSGSFAGTVTTLPQQDAIVLGGTTTTYGGRLTTNAFQGYHTTIDQNYFNQIQRAVYARTHANAVRITNNSVWQECGGVAAIELLGYDASNTTSGVYVSGNLIEVGYYVTGISLTQYATANVVIGNGFWDPSTTFAQSYILGTGSTGNTFIGNFGVSSRVPTGVAVTSNNYVAEPGPLTLGPQISGYGSLLSNNLPHDFYTNGAGGTYRPNTFFYSRGTYSAPTSVFATDYLGGIEAWGWSGGTSSYKQAAVLRAIADTGDEGAIGGGWWIGTTSAGSPDYQGSAAYRWSVNGKGGAIRQWQETNYIATESGAANAIAGALVNVAGANVAMTAGLRVVVKLAHTLQAGANTFNLNAGGAVSIKSHNNVANDIAAAYAVGSMVDLMYDGTQWQDMSQ